MYFYNHRLLEGKPLHYYHYNSQSPPRVDLISSQFPTNFFPGPDKLTCLDQTRDSIMPLPPTSPQSDSENSICSVEVPYKELNSVRPTNNSKSDCICYWINCGLSFESLDLLANHVSRVHAASGPGGLFYCRWEGCTRNNKGFNARYKMLVHVRTHTNEKPHKCSECEKSFSRAENLKIHIRSHSGEKPYVCSVPGCNKAYSNSSDRFKHTRTHQVEKPYQCKVPGCPKRYTDPSSLRKHVKTYKHFVTEEKKAPESISPRNVSVIVSNRTAGGNEDICEKDAAKTTEHRLSESLTETKSCSCGCANKSYYLSEKDDCISYEKMMCFKNSSFDTVSWNVLTSYTAQKNIYKPYELHQEEMEIDLPLDLSISTRE